MSTSTNAILFYGFSFDEEGEEQELPFYDEDEGLDADGYYRKKMGLRHEYHEGESDEEAKLRWAEEKAIDAANPCDMDFHCSGDYSIYYTFIKESRTVAHRGDVEEIKSLEIKPEWNDQLRKYCEIMGLEYKDPKWCLVSLWF